MTTENWGDVAKQVKAKHKQPEHHDAYRMARIAVERIGWPLEAGEREHLISAIAKTLWWQAGESQFTAIMEYEEGERP